MASSMARISERGRASTELEDWFEDDGFSTRSPPRLSEEFGDVVFGKSLMKASTSKRFYNLRSEREGHFLQACYLCRRPLGDGDDIFMYRGDTPFCSEECRQEQIDKDEAEEKMWSSVKAMNKSKGVAQQMKKSPTKLHIRTGTVAAG